MKHLTKPDASDILVELELLKKTVQDIKSIFYEDKLLNLQVEVTTLMQSIQEKDKKIRELEEYIQHLLNIGHF